MKKKNLVLSGGSFRGYCYLGIFKYIHETYPNFFESIENIVGVSVGSIFGTLLCLGYNSNDLIKIFFEINETKFRNINTDSVLNILNTYGLDDGEKLIKLITIFFKSKGFDADITFKQLYDITNKNLIIVGCCINTTEEVHFNYKTYPEMSIIKAIRISTSVPLLFNPVKMDNKFYMDGGMINNFPIEVFEHDLENTLGILLVGEDYYNNEINTFQNYISGVIRCSMFNNIKKKMEKYKDIILKIECTFTIFDLEITKEEKQKLIDLGYDKMCSFIKT